LQKQTNLSDKLEEILQTYHDSFSAKVYNPENEDTDLLMNVFGITQERKRENRQYWGRELGKCWERLVVTFCKSLRDDFKPALKIGSDEPCDLVIGKYAIDTKYRIGSGDSGTLKKFRLYSKMLKQEGYQPLLLILREDNLPAAITACRRGGWKILQGKESLDFLKEQTSKDLVQFLEKRVGKFDITVP